MGRGLFGRMACNTLLTRRLKMCTVQGRRGYELQLYLPRGAPVREDLEQDDGEEPLGAHYLCFLLPYPT